MKTRKSQDKKKEVMDKLKDEIRRRMALFLGTKQRNGVADYTKLLPKNQKTEELQRKKSALGGKAETKGAEEVKRDYTRDLYELVSSRLRAYPNEDPIRMMSSPPTRFKNGHLSSKRFEVPEEGTLHFKIDK